MKALVLALAVLLAAAGVFIFIQHQAQQKLQADNADLAAQNDKLKTDNTDLSQQVTQANNQVAADKGKLDELLKLRGEVSGLRQQAGQVTKLRDQIDQLQKNPPAALSQSPAVDPAEAQRQIMIAKINNARQGVLAFLMYAQDNQNVYPTNYTQIAQYANTNLLSELQDNFEQVYAGPVAGIANPANTIVLRQKQAMPTIDGKWSKAYGFADGHAETHTSPDGNFDEWENQRIMRLPIQE